jgi:thermitase
VLGTNGYGYKSGCSMATPYASAVAALIKSAKPSLTNTELRALMEKTAIDLGSPGKVPIIPQIKITYNFKG